MPHSSRNLQRVPASDGTSAGVLRPKWPLIVQKLRLLACMEHPIDGGDDDDDVDKDGGGDDSNNTSNNQDTTPTSQAQNLAETILALNPAYRGTWDLRGLVRFLGARGPLTARERQHLFFRTLPRVAALASALPALCRAPLPLLRAHTAGTVALTRRQVACLLAHAFFCTFPRRSPPLASASEYRDFPTVNFASLYSSRIAPCKLRFLLHYFSCITEEEGKDGTGGRTSALDRELIVIERAVLRERIDWARSRAPLCAAQAHGTGLIEDQAGRMAMVDFANRRLGGGVLGRGSVQEEILFLIYPELLATRLVCEALADTDAVIVRGAVRYASYAGYAASLAFAGGYSDPTPAVPAGPAHPAHTVRDTTFVAIDALDYTSDDTSDGASGDGSKKDGSDSSKSNGNNNRQYSFRCITREANKAYCGFAASGRARPLATGNWGCGVFGGDRELKALVQLAAASQAHCPAMHYYAVDDRDGFVARFNTLVTLLRAANVTVGRLMSWLFSFSSASATASSTAYAIPSASETTTTPDTAPTPSEQGQQKRLSVFGHVHRCLAKATETEHRCGDVTK